MAKKVAKTKAIGRPTDSGQPSIPNPQPSFEAAYNEVLPTLTAKQYENVRLKMMQTVTKSAMSDTMLVRLNQEWATKEYTAGSDAIQGTLKWLWDKYIAHKIKDQFLANIIFGVLVKGIDEAYQAFINWLRGKNAATADNLEDAISTAAQVAQSDKLVEFKAEIEAHVEDVKRRNEADAQATSKKLGWFRKFLNIVKSIFN